MSVGKLHTCLAGIAAEFNSAASTKGVSNNDGVDGSVCVCGTGTGTGSVLAGAGTMMCKGNLVVGRGPCRGRRDQQSLTGTRGTVGSGWRAASLCTLAHAADVVHASTTTVVDVAPDALRVVVWPDACSFVRRPATLPACRSRSKVS